MDLDLTDARWRKSSRSQGGGQCVELAHVNGFLAIRDSKHPGGAALIVDPATLRSLQWIAKA